ncbi:MAG: cytochrome c biogenesis protein CcdA [Candidatus Saccharimonas sp.]
MELILVSFAAGALTILAPCLLPLIPVIIGGSSLGVDGTVRRSVIHPLIITLSLMTSIIVFTLLLKASTALLGVPTVVWNSIAGGVVVLFGVNTLFPQLWESVMAWTGLQAKTSQLLGKTNAPNKYLRDILLGAALGPVFNSCSPTYLLIVAVVLPASFGVGLLNLFAYVLGLGIVLFLVGVFGRSLVSRIKWMSRPGGVFQRIVGVTFVILGICIMIGADKQIQSFVLEKGWYDPIMHLEEAVRP